MLASNSIPVIFKPIEYRNHILVDGGLLNNLPVEPLLNDKLPIIGVYVNPVAIAQKFSNTFRVMERCFNLAVYANVKERMQLCDLVIEPPELRKYSVHQFSKAEEIFSIGYDYAKSIRNIGDKINFTISRNGLLKSINVTLINSPKVSYTLDRVEKPNEKQEKVYKKWLSIGD